MLTDRGTFYYFAHPLLLHYYYPLFAHLAQTGQILKSRNRPGNVHDSKGADAFLRELIGELRGQFGRSRKLEFRTDAAFFNEKILKNVLALDGFQARTLNRGRSG